MKTIKINEKEYFIKQTIRSIFLWEQIAQKPFEIKTTLDNYLYFYCILLANNEDFMSWDGFINCLDQNPSIVIELTKKLTQSQEMEKLLNPDTDNENGDKKKSLTIAELYSILTLQLGLNPEYVLDKIEMYEINSLMKYSYYKDKENWEQARLLGYIIAQANSTKKLKIEDIIKFSWDNKNKEKGDTTISKEQIDALTKQAMEMEKMFQQNQ